MDEIETEAYRLLLDPTPPRDSRPPSKMKPNTRFLQHIVRNANSHNAALLARETADSQRRLKRLMRSEHDGPSASDGGDDQDDDKDDDRHSRPLHKRRRNERDGDASSHRSSHHRSDAEGDASSHRSSHHHRGERDDRDRSTRHKAHRSHRDTRSRSRSRERHERHRSSKHRRRSESPERAREGRLSPPDTHAHRDRSPRRTHRTHRSRHHDETEAASRSRHRAKREHAPLRRDKDRALKRAGSAERARSRSLSRSASDSDSASSDSDPLDEFVGPRLASDNARADRDRVRKRGRGAFSAAALGGTGSSIDRHFAADYDPSTDVETQADARIGSGGATDDAQKEMQRDRKKLQLDGAERLRAAGFTEKEIAIWSRGGRKTVAAHDTARAGEAAVPWAKVGEAREWDRGKEVGDDGPARPIWAR